MEEGSAEAKNRLILIEQFAYFADELEAQQLIMSRIPESILAATPYEGAVSIRDRYVALSDREARHYREISGVMEAGGSTRETEAGASEEINSIQELLRSTAEARRDLAERLRNISESSWSTTVLTEGDAVPLSTWVYRVVLGDADDLREIGVHFSEMQLQFRKEN